MCCLRYEHEFYVQSRKRFPKEGKIFVTPAGEAKIVSVDIFRERITLRGVEGDIRTITLAEFKQETEQLAGAAIPAASVDEDEGAEGIRPEEISPELMYTAEHPVFVPRENISVPGPNGNGNGQTRSGEHESSGKRRRGRRGGRRGRGPEDPNSSGGH